MKRVLQSLVALVVLLSVQAFATDVTFHVHQEGNPGQSLLYLQTGGPDAASTFSESANLKNVTGYFSIPSIYKYLSTAPGTRVIPSGSSLEFKLWMMKTANWGVMYPHVIVYLFDNFSNPNVGGRQLCAQTGDSTTVIGTSLGSTPKVVNCSVSSDVVLGP